MSSWESAGAFLGWMGKLREKHLGRGAVAAESDL